MMSMENPDVFHDKDCSENTSLTLLDLPVEVFLHICSFLDASSLIHGLGSACKKFYDILSDDSLWKVRIGQIWQNARYPVIPPDEDDELFWKQSCIGIEKHLSYWNDKKSIHEIRLLEGHYGGVDTLMLIEKGQIMISGGRDRSLCCWNLRTYEDDSVNSYQLTQMAHDGWIWDLTSMNETFYSCSWDKTIKSWNLNNLRLEPVRKFQMDVYGAVLCITSYPDGNLIASGSQCRTVILFDPRVDRGTIARYRNHQRAVLRIAMNDKYVLTASEDRTVIVWDQRAGRVMKTIEISKDCFPMSMIMEKGAVHIGDSIGNMHLLNPKKDFELVKTYATGHTKGIKSLCSTPGGLITGSLDRTVRLLSPTDPPRLITTLSSSVGEIAGMDYMNGVLGISGQYIHIWQPKTGSDIESSVC